MFEVSAPPLQGQYLALGLQQLLSRHPLLLVFILQAFVVATAVVVDKPRHNACNEEYALTKPMESGKRVASIIASVLTLGFA